MAHIQHLTKCGEDRMEATVHVIGRGSSTVHVIGGETLMADFNLWQNFIGTNVLTKTTAPPPPWGPSIVRTNVLIKFHKDWIINVTSRVLTRKNATPPCGHVFLTDFNHF
ncbi:hypothetical protein DPMN_026632 [Dreissena polymorpha]|uniref:Uncharacterized protein n=1 Tax=Dreissena polymorpha TaxID=45954 RepID=A0A9D4LTT6_DREPO|nr:hypothetical protein DPMN_026632 [Dreissena polymorpha]